MKPRIVIIGAGAVGGYLGARLAQAGEDVTLVARWQQQIDTIHAQGLTLEELDPAETATIHLPILHWRDAARHIQPGSADIVLLAVKSYDTAEAATLGRGWLSPQGLMASLQNGLPEAALAGIVGPARTAGIVVARISTELAAPGLIRRAARRLDGVVAFRVGEHTGPATPRIHALAQLLSLVDRAEPTDDLSGERWSKLCANAMRSGMSAVTGLPTPEIDRDPTLRRIAIHVAAEAAEVAHAAGQAVTQVGGIPAALLRQAGQGDAASLEAIETQLLNALAKIPAGAAQRPSMGQDILKGRATEVDAIYGAILREAEALNIPVPTNRLLHGLVRRLEAGGIAPHPTLLTDAAAATTL